MIELIQADWPAPKNVIGCTTTRTGGVSGGAFTSLNLASHVGDDPVAVSQNRQRLSGFLQLAGEPAWLDQVHGNTVVEADAVCQPADASITQRPGVTCAVLTADCLPLLMCDRKGTRVAAVHAGWRGLHAGVISAAVHAFDCAPQDVLVWLGPAIGPQSFEVGAEVLTAFSRKNALYQEAFEKRDDSHWSCDIYRLARIELMGLGVTAVYGGGLDTMRDEARFFSYRRAQAGLDTGVDAARPTGRMASLIWLQPV